MPAQHLKAELRGEPKSSPLALCTTYEGHDSAYLKHVLPYVDYIEVTPDAIAEKTPDGSIRLHAESMADLKAINKDVKIILHGIGLSIASHDGYNQEYIKLLDTMFDQLDITWHSEHLAYTQVDGKYLGTMLAVPKTQEMLDIICERIKTIMRRYPVPFMLENVVHLLPDYPGDFTDAQFLNHLIHQTGCGLLMDAYNLECDAQNHGFDIDAFLAELDTTKIKEMHLAGGTELDGILVDVHSRATRDSTLKIAQKIMAKSPNLEVITYEILPQAIPQMGFDGISGELTRLRSLLLQHA